ncbi:alkaline phosphatase family protein [soil metagenome]
MLPAIDSRRSSLADVLPSVLESLSGRTNRLGLPPAQKAIVLLVDGLGSRPLAARSGHARTLTEAIVGRASSILSRFPTTTASALASFSTGEAPGVHGLVGYSVLDAAHDRVVNQLSGWDDRLDPATWQRLPTLFERAGEQGIRSFAVGQEKHRGSGFTAAVLRGAEYLSGISIADRLGEAIAALERVDTGFAYVYVPELDQLGHAKGWQSSEWTAALEILDQSVAGVLPTLARGVGLLATADHGVLDVPASGHIMFDSDPGLIDGVRHSAGEPRVLHLYFEPDASAAHREVMRQRWFDSEGERAWVLTRSQAVQAGWFGPAVAEEVLPRIGDLVVAARKAVAYYDGRVATPSGLAMIGQHGSWSPDETEIPLLRFGAYSV